MASKREIALLHERRAAQLIEEGCSGFDEAQEHLDNALSIWSGYKQSDLMARTWCLKGCCSGKAGDYAKASASFKRAQHLAERADDAMLAVTAMINRAICEIQIGDAKGAATSSRRAFVKAQTEGGSQMTFLAHVIRAVSYQMAGNFLAACNEHEAAAMLAAVADNFNPEPRLALAMDINQGISVLRSGKPERAVALFEKTLATVRSGIFGGQPSLTLACCIFHTGEARRQAHELTGARALLDEAEAMVAMEAEEVTASSGVRKSDLAKWAALAIEVANSKGLCTLQEGARGFRIQETAVDLDAGGAAVQPQDQRVVRVERNELRRDERDCDGDHDVDLDHDNDGKDGRTERGRGSANAKETGRQAQTAAEEAAMIFAAGAKARVPPAQRARCAILEGVAWSLAGRSSTNGAAALTRADQIVENLREREKRPVSPDGRVVPELVPDIVGSSVSAGNESDGQPSMLQLGLVCIKGLMVRGGLGLGFACTTGTVTTEVKTARGNAGVRAAAAANWASARKANSGWAKAALLVKKQLDYAGQVSTDSAHQLSVAHAHAGAIDLMTGRPTKAVVQFELQRHEAQKACDTTLEALAERNLADAGEVNGDMRKALRHLREYRALAQRGRNAALEADACRRLSSMYAEIAAAASLGSESTAKGEAEHQDLTADDGPANLITETDVEEAEDQVEEKEDSDVDFLNNTAAVRARLFAERYEAAVVGLQWPVGGRLGVDGREEVTDSRG